MAISPFSKNLVATAIALSYWLSFCAASLSPSFDDQVKDAALIQKICRQPTVQPIYKSCVRLVSSDPQSASSNDLKVIAMAAVEQDFTGATYTLVHLEDLKARARGTIKTYLSKCVDKYKVIYNLTNQARNDLRKKSFLNVRAAALAAGKEARDCENTFNGPPARLGSPVTYSNTITSNYGIIIAAIVNLIDS